MMNDQFSIILASASPRRLALLQQIGWQPVVKPVDIDESSHVGEAAQDYCLRMALEKSEAAVSRFNSDVPIITADTVVALDDEILGKPISTSNALLTLIKLSGRTHQVYSAVSVSYQGKTASKLSANDVTMSAVDENMLKNYVKSGEPMDKAGAYGIQGMAAMWIEHISGSYSSIMGLPLFETTALLNELRVPLPLTSNVALNQ